MTWTTTHLNAGPLATNTYDYNVTGLSAGTNYRYRAYMVVDGVEYYGNALTGKTCNVVLTLPSVTTGGLQASTLTPTSFGVSDNIITSSGNTTISEYGLLYTQESAWGNDAGLTIDNNPSHNTKDSGVTCVTSIPFTYTSNAINLLPNTSTFYRAYAKNVAGVAYGEIKNQVTAVIPPTYYKINVEILWNDEINFGKDDGFEGSYALYCCNNTLVETVSVPSYSKSNSFSWTVLEGCYYVDFSGLSTRVNNYIICNDLYWKDNFSDGYYSVTDYFSGDNVISAELPLLL